jgi:hypothetical protein
MAEKPPEKKNWEEEFFTKHNITDDKEKAAIRSRSLISAYDRARVKAEESEDTPKPKKWYDE